MPPTTYVSIGKEMGFLVVRMRVLELLHVRRARIDSLDQNLLS